MEKRGSLIVIEGLDKTGKTTQCNYLIDNLIKNDIKIKYMKFPDRNTEIGIIINNYLKSNKKISDEVIHLLFSANRWEKYNEIIKTLEMGITIIMDRYCYSGVAYSASKGIDINWCKYSDIGLPKPDKVIFLYMDIEKIAYRNNYGDEIYEKIEFQKKVYDLFLKLKDDSWYILDADRPEEVIQNDILEKTLYIIKNTNYTLNKLW
ncbi:thymidylate kinase [Mythimna separata entomopoxvirus 'L']|uniref:Thymidylate kinase n=1 Tax=Mythimna separata entomopoxvirus 'L' TaxID=1293572 RepID=A0A916KQC3_9POXV|nr:thymidylate kinase [Mythimna separata entomopoxvirus 'L']CCU56373.1 thymidylate kinase [Mythimna separata entomopoxvirus 'L']